MPSIGIDLGTTNSLISVFTDDGPELIPNALGHFLTPSAVGVSDSGDIVVGTMAKDRLVTHPRDSAARFKRYMGTEHKFKLGKTVYRAEDLSALVLKSLRNDAETFLGRPIKSAVVSVPAYFNDIQRKATLAACQIAGLEVQRLINEPTAAALAYGLNAKDQESTFLVVDLGGGTFDVSILEIFDGIMEVRSSSGDAFLGGEDFTDAIFNHFAKELGKEFKKLKDVKLGLLRSLAERAKVELSSSASVTAKFSAPSGMKELTITQDQFHELTQSLQEKIRFPLQRVIRDAGLNVETIDRVILVGGATRMPLIRNLITRLLKKFPEHSLDPDEVIALGAAVQAGLVDRHAALEDIVMTDVAPFTLGKGVSSTLPNGKKEAGHFMPVIERNTVIPASRSVRTQTTRKGQKKVDISVYQGESPRIVDNVFLGKMSIDVPYNKDGYEGIETRFTYDVSGILEVLTKTSDGKVARMVIEGHPGTMSEEEIEKRLNDLNALKIHPNEKIENSTIIARLKRSYENHLGDLRDQINNKLTEFDYVLEKQNETDIKIARENITQWLDQLDSMDIF